jgi:hypothetical protein
MITTVKPMSADHGRALAIAYQLHQLLGQLYDRPENGPGSPVEQAWDHLDEAVHLLEPPELEERTPRALRLAEERRVRR